QSQMDFSLWLVAAMSAARTTSDRSGFVSGRDSGNPRGGSRAPKATNEDRALASETGPLAVLILGPTGSGKTALSLALAERFGGEIVNCDSVAVYRGMDLGTAKPTAEERARIPH